ncbi:MAG: PAS domain S-box protein [Armatimonadetes bacterium]|nr:PAS domain S-box protein [Armatimonadota bacterium]
MARPDIPADVRALLGRLAAERDALLATTEARRGRLRDGIVAVAGSATMAQANIQLLSAALELTGLEAGGVYGTEGDWLVLRHHIGLPPAMVEQVRYMPLDSPVVVATLAEPRPLDLITNCGHLSALRSQFGLTCGYAIAIRARDEVVGFVNVASAHRYSADAGGLEALCALAAETGSVLLRFRAEQAAHQDRAMLRGVLDAIPDAVCVKDLEGRYRAVNPAFERLIDRPAKTIIGSRSSDLFEPDTAARLCAVDAQVLADGRTRQVEEAIPGAQGRVAYTETRKSPLLDQRGRTSGVVGVARDIQQRHHEQMLQAARVRLLEYAQTHSLHEVLVATLDEAEWLTGSLTGFFHFVDPLARSVAVQAWSTRTTTQFCRAQALAHSYEPDEVGVWAECLELCQPVVRNDYAARPGRRALPEGHATVERVLTVPVLRNGLPVAVLGVGNKPRDYGDDDVELVYQLADLAWEIAAWRQAEEARQTSERRLALLTASVKDTLFEVDRSGQLTYVNGAVEGLLGYLPEEILGRDVWDLVPPEDYCTAEQRQALANACARSERVEIRMITRDGRTVWIEVVGNALLDDNGEWLAVHGVARDITEHRHAEQAMARSEARFRVLVERSPEAIVVHRDATIVLANAAALALLGADSEAQLLGRSAFDFVHPTQRGEVSERMRLLADTQSVPPMEQMLFRLDGTLLDVEVAPAPVTFDGQPAVQVVLRDVGERKLVERLLRTTVEGTAQTTGMAFFAALARALAEAADCAGCFVAEIVDGRLRSLAHVIEGQPQPAFDLPLDGAAWAKLVAGGVLSVSSGADAYWPSAPCRSRLESFSAAILPASDGQPIGVITLWHDGPILTSQQIEPLLRICAARAGAELERVRSLTELRHLVTAMDQAGESIVITDPHGALEYVNPAFERLTGYQRDEVLGQLPSVLRSDEHSADFYAHLWRTINSGAVWSGRVVDRHRDGHLLTSEMTIAPVVDEKGQTARFVAVQRDVSREMALEAELRQAQKMEAIGQLAGGIAHDLNNVLTPILGHAETSMAEFAPGDPRRQALGEIVSASHRARDLVKQLLAFGRRQTLVVSDIDLGEVVRDFQSLMRRSLRDDIEIALELAPEPLFTRADRGQIEQVLLNLALNAQDAMPDGGRLTLRTEPRHVAVDCGPLAAGEYVALTVADTGHGMDDTTRERIFEPFFSTKGDLGTGLGLATSFGIIQQHRGQIEVHSRVGAGATFTILLPQGTSAPVSAPEPDVAPPPAASGATVLIAEDEPGVRLLASRICSYLGYHVVTAETAEECLACAEQEPIDVLFTDVVMPGLNGRQLADQIRAIRPTVRVLMASGYARDVLGERAQLGPHDVFIQKPYELAELAAALQRVLADT